ncbi:uncharacterized protein LOC127732571 [Mytilus californianus]|uniref:uncharacterized protein LOC127732571 n=1 Tax=Mytilus californianus TaxID=6549 RepID=UPI002247EBCD|nr:uncharacterized protein LOC127732571 [Mytilus californianus]
MFSFYKSCRYKSLVHAFFLTIAVILVVPVNILIFYQSFPEYEFLYSTNSRFNCRSADHHTVSMDPMPGVTICGSTQNMFKYKGVYVNKSFDCSEKRLNFDVKVELRKKFRDKKYYENKILFEIGLTQSSISSNYMQDMYDGKIWSVTAFVCENEHGICFRERNDFPPNIVSHTYNFGGSLLNTNVDLSVDCHDDQPQTENMVIPVFALYEPDIITISMTINSETDFLGFNGSTLHRHLDLSPDNKTVSNTPVEMFAGVKKTKSPYAVLKFIENTKYLHHIVDLDIDYQQYVEITEDLFELKIGQIETKYRVVGHFTAEVCPIDKGIQSVLSRFCFFTDDTKFQPSVVYGNHLTLDLRYNFEMNMITVKIMADEIEGHHTFIFRPEKQLHGNDVIGQFIVLDNVSVYNMKVSCKNAYNYRLISSLFRFVGKILYLITDPCFSFFMEIFNFFYRLYSLTSRYGLTIVVVIILSCPFCYSRIRPWDDQYI